MPPMPVKQPTPVRKMMTFEDIHKMHYSLLQLSDEHGSFQPSDLVDFESGDSDHEILAKYKPRKQT